MQNKIIKVNSADNVAVALINLKAGEIVNFEGKEIHVLSNTKSKHKISLERFESGDRIIMYGVLVGTANGSIEKGAVLTINNVKHQSDKVFGKTESFWSLNHESKKSGANWRHG